jgi:hypothetical protein
MVQDCGPGDVALQACQVHLHAGRTGDCRHQRVRGVESNAGGTHPCNTSTYSSSALLSFPCFLPAQQIQQAHKSAHSPTQHPGALCHLPPVSSAPQPTTALGQSLPQMAEDDLGGAGVASPAATAPATAVHRKPPLFWQNPLRRVAGAPQLVNWGGALPPGLAHCGGRVIASGAPPFAAARRRRAGTHWDLDPWAGCSPPHSCCWHPLNPRPLLPLPCS